MSTKKKRKIKIKKKNFAILILCIFLIIFIPIKTINIISKSISKHQIKIKEEKKNKEKNNNEQINKSISYYNEDYLSRYLKYKKEHIKLSDEQIIKNVNMNLDLKQYEDTIKAKNLNTEKVLVNKYYYLEEDYVPDNLEKISTQYALNDMQLVKEAKEAFEKMVKTAKKKI